MFYVLWIAVGIIFQPTTIFKLFVLLFIIKLNARSNILKNNYLRKILYIIPKEQKQIFLLGDFNVNLLNYNQHSPSNYFVDSLASNYFMQFILQPTGITCHSKIVVDNIYFLILLHIKQYLVT